MRIYLPNSAHLQNIEGFLRRYTPGVSQKLQVSGHPKYIHLHPVALAFSACAGATAEANGWITQGKLQNVKSVPYLVRMKLFEFLRIKPPRAIQEHEEAGRFVPLTQIRSSDDLSRTITDMIPLLHATPNVADPIRYVISELGRNVLEHAGSEVGAFVCAQYFKDQQRMAIGMADSGRGILAAIQQSHSPGSEEEAFRLALRHQGCSWIFRRKQGHRVCSQAGADRIGSCDRQDGDFGLQWSVTHNSVFCARPDFGSAATKRRGCSGAARFYGMQRFD